MKKFQDLYYSATQSSQQIHFRTSDVKDMFTNIQRAPARQSARTILKAAMRLSDPHRPSRFTSKYPMIEYDRKTKSVTFTRCPDMTKTVLDLDDFSHILEMILNNSYLTIGGLVAIQMEGLAMGNSTSMPLAVGQVMVNTHDQYISKPPPTAMIPAVGYADDTGELSLDGFSWLQSVLEPELRKNN
eukprot:gene5124-5210_t